MEVDGYESQVECFSSHILSRESLLAAAVQARYYLSICCTGSSCFVLIRTINVLCQMSILLSGLETRFYSAVVAQFTTALLVARDGGT